MARLEYLQNVGQATPAAVFQSLAWAFLKGHYQIMTRMIGLDDTARRTAQVLIASMPEDQRAQYSTPESLFALFLAKALVNVSAIQIVETARQDPLNATISVRGLTGNSQNLPMRLGATGWQLWEGEAQANWIRAELAGQK
jgi:hypothetical protein